MDGWRDGWMERWMDGLREGCEERGLLCVVFVLCVGLREA